MKLDGKHLTSPNEEAALPELTDAKFATRFALRLINPEFANFAKDLHDKSGLVNTRVSPRVAKIASEVRTARKRSKDAQSEFESFSFRLLWGARSAAFCFAVLALAAFTDSVFSSGRVIDLQNFFGSLDSTARDVMLGLISTVAAGGILLLEPSLASNSIKAQIARESKDQALQKEARLETRLNFEVDAELRRLSSQLSATRGILGVPPIAPGLVELDGVEILDTETIQRLRDFIGRSRTSSIALAGPRGIGKSTTIRALTSDRSMFDVAVVVPAPVTYDPESLVRRVHRDLATAILDREGARRVLAQIQESAVFAMRRRRRYLAMLSFVVGMLLLFLSVASSVLGTFSVGTPGVIGLIMVFYAAASNLGTGGSSWRPRDGWNDRVTNAIEALEKLDYSTEVTEEAKVTTGLDRIFFSTEDIGARTRTPRDRGRVGQIAELRDFLRRDMAARSENDLRVRLPIAIAVDELDKLPDAASLIGTVNTLKDLFRFDAVHFIVSVSDEALAGFNLRSVAGRDTFDSSFDEVILIEPLNFLEASEIVNSRAIGFPEALLGVCFALAGGLPRELIRLTRKVVEVSLDGGQRLDQIAVSLVRAEVVELLSALSASTASDLTDRDRFLLEKALITVKYCADPRSVDDLSSTLLNASQTLSSARHPVLGQAMTRIDVARLSASLPPLLERCASDHRDLWIATAEEIADLSALDRFGNLERQFAMQRASEAIATLMAL